MYVCMYIYIYTYIYIDNVETCRNISACTPRQAPCRRPRSPGAYDITLYHTILIYPIIIHYAILSCNLIRYYVISYDII